MKFVPSVLQDRQNIAVLQEVLSFYTWWWLLIIKKSPAGGMMWLWMPSSGQQPLNLVNWVELYRSDISRLSTSFEHWGWPASDMVVWGVWALVCDTPHTHTGGKKRISQLFMLGNTGDGSFDAFKWIQVNVAHLTVTSPTTSCILLGHTTSWTDSSAHSKSDFS